jgi:hypothetical protein
VRVTVQVPLVFKLQLVVVGETAVPELKVTRPVGTVGPEVAVVATVAVQVDPWFTVMGVEQLIVVVVPCTPGVKPVVPLLELCIESPPM